MKYYYAKRCRSCNIVFFSKEISEEQFTVLEENPAIRCGWTYNEWIGEIQSCCGKCAEAYY